MVERKPLREVTERFEVYCPDCGHNVIVDVDGFDYGDVKELEEYCNLLLVEIKELEQWVDENAQKYMDAKVESNERGKVIAKLEAEQNELREALGWCDRHMGLGIPRQFKALLTIIDRDGE